MRAPSSVRIIGGKWRGRKLPVLNERGLRPTPDRVRETLFNWLMPFIKDAVVLDVCAGTGVLGIEALSRGASKAVLIEKNSKLCGAIRQTCDVLQAEVDVIGNDVSKLTSLLAGQRFDLVFVDPPYQSGLYSGVITHLVEGNHLTENALIYIETSNKMEVDFVPDTWQKIRSKAAGDVRYELFQASRETS